MFVKVQYQGTRYQISVRYRTKQVMTGDDNIFRSSYDIVSECTYGVRSHRQSQTHS